MISGGGDYINVGDKKVHICGYLKNFYLIQRFRSTGWIVVRR